MVQHQVLQQRASLLQPGQKALEPLQVHLQKVSHHLREQKAQELPRHHHRKLLLILGKELMLHRLRVL
jgi:hypothetical protein